MPRVRARMLARRVGAAEEAGVVDGTAAHETAAVVRRMVRGVVVGPADRGDPPVGRDYLPVDSAHQAVGSVHQVAAVLDRRAVGSVLRVEVSVPLVAVSRRPEVAQLPAVVSRHHQVDSVPRQVVVRRAAGLVGGSDDDSVWQLPKKYSPQTGVGWAVPGCSWAAS